MIKRCDKTLNEYEEKLHLVSRFEKTKEQVDFAWYQQELPGVFFFLGAIT